jgi:hypothetical protein
MSGCPHTESAVLAGDLASHPCAASFAEQVWRVHRRYASEVVGGFELCPFMHDPDTAFGVFCVMLERAPQLDTALAQIGAAATSVVHLVYPLVSEGARDFERFGSKVRDELMRREAEAPVHASFHPGMEGGPESSGRLVGLLRRAPDPFVQIVPAGLHKGGTVFMDAATFDAKEFLNQPLDPTSSNFKRLDADAVSSIERLQHEIRADRDAVYAPFLEQLL